MFEKETNKTKINLLNKKRFFEKSQCKKIRNIGQDGPSDRFVVNGINVQIVYCTSKENSTTNIAN